MRTDRLVLISLFILLPVVFWNYLREGYELTKWFVLRWGVVLIFAAVLWRLLRPPAPRLRRTRNDNKQIFVPFFIYPFAAFLFFSVLSLGEAVNVEIGVLTVANLILGLSLFFFISNYTDELEVKNFLPILILPALPVALYGIFQLFGFDFVTHQGPFKGAISTFGHRNFVAEYELMLLPLLLYVAFFCRARNWRLYSIISLPFVYCHFILTHTRGSYVALMASLLFLAGTGLRRFKTLNRVLIVLFLLTAIFFWRFFNLPGGERVIGKGGIATLPSVARNDREGVGARNDMEEAVAPNGIPSSLRSRLLIWKATLTAFGRHPVIGVGAGNLNEVIPLYYSEELLRMFIGRLEAGTSHNEYLQALAETGIPGGLSFTVLLLSILIFGVKTGRSNLVKKADPLSLFLTAAIFGISVAGVTSSTFQRPVTIFLFWLFIGFLVVLGRELTKTVTLTRKAQERALLAFLVLTLIPAYHFGWDALRADFYGSKSFHAFRNGDRKSAVFFIKEALKYQPRDRHLLTIAGNTFLNTGDFDSSVKAYGRAIIYHPHWPQGYANLGLALTQKGSLAEAETHLKYSLRLDPYQPLVHNTLGVLYIQQERYDEAKKEFLKALSLDPSLVYPKLNLQELERRRKKGIK